MKYLLILFFFFNSSTIYADSTQKIKRHLSEDEKLILAYEKAKEDGSLNKYNSETYGNEQDFSDIYSNEKVPQKLTKEDSSNSGIMNSASTAYKQLMETDFKKKTSEAYDSTVSSIKKGFNKGVESTKEVAKDGYDASKKYVTDWFKKTWEESKKEQAEQREKQKKERAAEKKKAEQEKLRKQYEQRNR